MRVRIAHLRAALLLCVLGGSQDPPYAFGGSQDPPYAFGGSQDPPYVFGGSQDPPCVLAGSQSAPYVCNETPAGLPATGVVPPGGASWSGAETSRLTRTLVLPPEGTIAIRATVGEVTVEAWERPETRIEIVRTVPTVADLDRLPASITQEGARAEIVAVQANEGLDAALQSAITVHTSPRVGLDGLELFEGRIALKGLTRFIRAAIKRGPLDATNVAGTVRLETSIGDLTVRDARVTPDGLLRLRAFNGNVRLQLAATPTDARILAVSFNGAIRSTLPLTRRTGFGPRFGEATFGRGEPVISIDVVNGDITIEAPR